METNLTADREPDETVHKCAQWEEFSFNVNAPGMVEVTSESHKSLADHQYMVSIDGVTGELMACTYPHYDHWNVFCKNMAIVDCNHPDRDTFP